MSSGRIYIVEDHSDMLESYRMFFDFVSELEVCGISETGEDAIARIPASQCDLAIVDISLPQMSGLDVVRALKDKAPGVRTLIVTGHSDGRYRAEAADAGADGFAIKGDPVELLSAVEALLPRMQPMPEQL